jgi:hypothetical protein
MKSSLYHLLIRSLPLAMEYNPATIAIGTNRAASVGTIVTPQRLSAIRSLRVRGQIAIV